MRVAVVLTLLALAMFLGAASYIIASPPTNIPKLVAAQIEPYASRLDGIDERLEALKSRQAPPRRSDEFGARLAAIDGALAAFSAKLSEAVQVEHDDKADTDAQIQSAKASFSDFELRLKKTNETDDHLQAQLALLSVPRAAPDRSAIEYAPKATLTRWMRSRHVGFRSRRVRLAKLSRTNDR